MRALLLLLVTTLHAQNFAEPYLAPNRAEIYFSSGGDIWRAPDQGGEASLLVSHPADDSRPIPSPDGKYLAFQSTRTGAGDIYLLELDTNQLRRLTFDGGIENLNAWSHDGRYVYYHSSSREISGMNDIYRVAATGGTPERVVATQYTSEFFAAPHPDGKSLAFVARGNSATQWWRHGHSHLDESELWLQRENQMPTKLMPRGAKHLWPMWSADGKTLYYMADEGNHENLYSLIPGQKPKALTAFTTGRLLWPSISYSGKAIVFERNFKLHRLDLANNKVGELPITLRGLPATQVPERRVLSQGFSNPALSADGKKLAFVARGEVFATSARDGGEAFRVTRSAGPESGLAWAPDSTRLAYRTEQGSNSQIYFYDFAKKAETPVTSGVGVHSLPRWSPDGKGISYIRNGQELMVYEVERKQSRQVAKARFGLPPLDGQYQPSWSPDSKYIAYIAKGDKNFRNVLIVPAAGGESKAASFLPNMNSSNVTWAPDGESLYFSTNQRTETSHIVKIDLRIKGTPLREDRFDSLFETPAKKDDKKPTVIIDWDNIGRRATLLPLDLDTGAFAVSPDGKTLVFTAQAGGQVQLYTVSIDPTRQGPMVPRQLTSTPGSKSSPQFSSDSKEVYFLDQGRLAAIPLDTRTPKSIAATAELVVDFESDQREVFSEVWSYLNAHFYDEKFHGIDWAATRERFERPVQAARSPEEFRRALNLMIGELNASHLGYSLGSAATTNHGRLGLDFDAGLKVQTVIPLGPAALAGGIAAGMTLTAINGAPVTNLDEQLEFSSGKKTILTLDGKTFTVRPISVSAEKQLRYKAWVDASRALVDKLSEGKLSYVHIPDMSEESLHQFYLDLDAVAHSRKGVVIDVRNNNGGFVNVYAIDVLARKSYFTMRERGDSIASPNRTALGQRALDLPTILLTNQHSLSDAEDFTEGDLAP
ncbi:MAG: peptidase S41 [Acidobacteria bacterium]|nr:peptidase S41 [Acidobacteriota bacterium]